LFLLPALAYLLAVTWRADKGRNGIDYLGVLPAVGGLCFGIIMVLKPVLFVGVLRLLMGVLLVALGLFHVFYLLLSRGSMRVRGWYYLCPLLVLVGGVLSLCLPVLREREPVVVLLTGVGLLLFNFTSLQEYIAQRRWRRAHPVVTDAQDGEGSSIVAVDKPADEISHDTYLPAVDTSAEDGE